eukprot:3388378-Rhodomonas_salina.2
MSLKATKVGFLSALKGKFPTVPHADSTLAQLGPRNARVTLAGACGKRAACDGALRRIWEPYRDCDRAAPPRWLKHSNIRTYPLLQLSAYESPGCPTGQPSFKGARSRPNTFVPDQNY